MQNRRILDGAFKSAGVSPAPEIETNSILNLFTNVQRGRLATILPDHFLDVLGEHSNVKALRLVKPVVSHKIGLLIADRDPASPVGRQNEVFQRLFRPGPALFTISNDVISYIVWHVSPARPNYPL